MAIKLVAEFMGLLAIVPGGPNNSVDVVSVNGAYRGYVDPVGEHETLLAVDTEFVCLSRHGKLPPACEDTPSLAPYRFIALPDGRRMAVWRLDHATVTVRSDKASSGGVKFWHAERDYGDEQPGTAATRGSRGTWKDLGWLANVYKASGDVLVDPKHLEPPAAPDDSPTQALVRLTQGTLTAGRPFDAPLREAKWLFSESGGLNASHTRAISDHTTLEIEANNLVMVDILPFGSTTPYVVRLASDSDDIPISISSLPVPPLHPAYGGTAIHHFRAFYNLLIADPKVYRIPRRDGSGGSTDPSPSPGGPGVETLAHFFAAASSSDCPPALVQRSR